MDKFGNQYKKCPICGNSGISLWNQKSHTYTKTLEETKFDIFKCNECVSGFLSPPPSTEFIKMIYKYSGHALVRPISLSEVMDKENEYPNTTIDAKRIIENADNYSNSGMKNTLDIGSGYGFYTKRLRELGYTVYSVNPGEYENLVFKELNGYLPIVGFFEEQIFTEQFSIVVMSQVLEHIINPQETIVKINRLMSVGGGISHSCSKFQFI